MGFRSCVGQSNLAEQFTKIHLGLGPFIFLYFIPLLAHANQTWKIRGDFETKFRSVLSCFFKLTCFFVFQ